MERFRPIQILLVEDNPDDIAIMERAFEKSEVVHHVTIARDGQEVIDLLLGSQIGSAFRPDLILLDINLPKLNGLNVLARIRARQQFGLLPIVVLTASGREEDVLASYRLGANSFIQKPVVFESLIQALEVLGRYWFEVATLPPR